jgi:homoserine dehydrogenase
VGCTCNEQLPIRDIGDLETPYYLRFRVVDEPGVFGRVATVFGDHGVSLASVIQKSADEPTAEIVYVTHRATERSVRSALAEIEQLDIVESVDTILRVEDL